ncbi:MAG: hypothetical protein K0Q61_105, partial [Rhodococcus erythropolis]|nr:hypothetical protein [Rhodococcus erythropolis]
MHLNTRMSRRLTLATSVGLSLALVTGCSSDNKDSAPPETTTTTASAPTEQASATPRLAVSYDGGILVLNATSLDVVGETKIDGFTRLNPAGDGRHVMISSGEAFKVL